MSRISLAPAFLLVLAAGLLTGPLTATAGMGKRFGSAPGGTLYVSTNLPSGNSIVAYRYDGNGRLNLIPNGVFPTGGAGLHQIDTVMGMAPPSGVLDADQQVIVNRQRTLLFVVNQGSNSVSVFHILPSGRLSLVPGSPFPSGGNSPVSVGLSGNVLVVVNKNADPTRWVPFQFGSAYSPTGQPSYNSFIVGPDGSLTPAASLSFGPFNASPSQALISPDGSLFFDAQFFAEAVVATRIGADGSLTFGPNSPLVLRDNPAVFPPGVPPIIPVAATLGMAVHPTLPLVYVNLPTVPALLVFSYDQAGTLTLVRSVPNMGVFAPCWIVITKDGRYLYVASTDTNNLSTYDVGTDPTTPRQIQLLQVKSGAGPFVGNPTQMALDPTDSFLFLLTPQHIDNVPPQFANTVHTMVVNQDGTLTELGASPAAIPVPPGTGPQGVVAITNGGGHEADDDEDEQGDDEDGGGGHNDGGSSERGRRFGSD